MSAYSAALFFRTSAKEAECKVFQLNLCSEFNELVLILNNMARWLHDFPCLVLHTIKVQVSAIKMVTRSQKLLKPVKGYAEKQTIKQLSVWLKMWGFSPPLKYNYKEEVLFMVNGWWIISNRTINTMLWRSVNMCSVFSTTLCLRWHIFPREKKEIDMYRSIELRHLIISVLWENIIDVGATCCFLKDTNANCSEDCLWLSQENWPITSHNLKPTPPPPLSLLSHVHTHEQT